MVRAPLLPIEAFPTDESDDEASRVPVGARMDDRTDHWHEQLRAAMAVASPSLTEALDRPRRPSRRDRVDRSVLRYRIRTSTRPTPFGLFAGVGLGRWGADTTLEIAAERRSRRTRPDMGWLLRLVVSLESEPDIRRQLRVVANPTALVRAGRVLLAERAATGAEEVPPAVSVRATGVVLRALEAARRPITFATLAEQLAAGTAGATSEQIDGLLDELWRQTLLLTDLRPPLTVAEPIQWVLDHLPDVPAADVARTGLHTILKGTRLVDVDQRGGRRMASLVAAAAALAPSNGPPFQVDSALPLTGTTVSPLVGREAARAASVLLAMSDSPGGPPHLAAYRRRFEQRYGSGRRVPVVELLDPAFGLGPLPIGAVGPPPPPSADGTIGRSQALLDLAVRAVRDRTRVVTLDPDTVERLRTGHPRTRDLPRSLDLVVSVAARSAAAVDAGKFLLVVGPAVGAMAAGRLLGRFADVVPGATAALAEVAAAEEACDPGPVRAELAYQPRSARLGNVTVRPNVRAFEVPLGVSSSREPEATIPVDELVVEVRFGRFALHWPRIGRDVEVTSTHMLNAQRAPALCRFLAEVGRDARTPLHGFSWGPASTFAFLPRVEVGRAVLSPARWRLRPADLPDLALVADPDRFRHALDRWRSVWDVPRHVHLGAADSRLLVDLAAPSHVEVLRHLLRRRRPAEPVVLTEALPDLDQCWVRDGEGHHYVTELVVPLILDSADGHPRSVDAAMGNADRGAPVTLSDPDPRAERRARLRPPGSDWVFAKLYLGPELEHRVLLDEIAPFGARALAAGVDHWFFLRYADPERHLRLRFHGPPDRLRRELVPSLCDWAGGLVDDDRCQRFTLDTYEREIERFGGDEGTAACEAFFAADTRAVLDLLRVLDADGTVEPIPAAVLSVDALLDGLGLSRSARADWSLALIPSRSASGSDYRTWKGLLRTLLLDGNGLRALPGGPALGDALASLRASAASLARTASELERRGVLRRPGDELAASVVHLHLNRLLGTDRSAEHRVLGLLWRLQHGIVRSTSTETRR